MKMINEKKYIEYLEKSVMLAARQIIKTKLERRFIILKYKDVKALMDKYYNGKNIVQASFHHEKLNSYERRVVQAGKVALNRNHMFIYDSHILDKIKSQDERILSSFKSRKEKRQAMEKS